MANKKDAKLMMIMNAEDVKQIDWNFPDLYDFRGTPEFVRRLVVGNFIREKYEQYRALMMRETGRVVSQNNYATNIVGIDHIVFSLIKNGHNLPNYEQADTMAAYYGPIIWDMCGYLRRMPEDKALYEIATLWSKLSKRARAELLERTRNLFDNGDTIENTENIDSSEPEKGLDTEF